VELVTKPGTLTFDRDHWGLLMQDESGAQKGDVFVYLPEGTIQHIKDSPLLDADSEDRKAIEGRLADIEKAATRKFGRGELAPSAVNGRRVIEISPADLDD
jgi:hypothetical protein